MSWTLSFDSPGSSVHTVSNRMYNNIDWGNHADDMVQFVDESGTTSFHYLCCSSTITASSGANLPAGQYSGWAVVINGKGGKAHQHVTEAVKDDIVAALGEDVDTIVTFDTMELRTLRIITANVFDINIYEETWDHPSPIPNP